MPAIHGNGIGGGAAASLRTAGHHRSAKPGRRNDFSFAAKEHDRVHPASWRLPPDSILPEIAAIYCCRIFRPRDNLALTVPSGKSQTSRSRRIYPFRESKTARSSPCTFPAKRTPHAGPHDPGLHQWPSNDSAFMAARPSMLSSGSDSFRYPSQLRTIEVRGNRKYPGRKRRIPAPTFKPAVGTQESFLRHVLRAAAIPAEAVRKVDQRPLPSVHNALECGDVSCQYPVDILLIFSSVHLLPPHVRLIVPPGSCIFFLSGQSRKKMQPRCSWTGPTE